MLTETLNQFQTPSDMLISGLFKQEFSIILTKEALVFLKELHNRFNGRRLELLSERSNRQAKIDLGELPDFITETAEIRNKEWKVAPPPKDLIDRRVEITGPVDRKMVINALNSGAKVFMADFDDSNTPSWINNISGQINLRDAIEGTIEYIHPKTGKYYRLDDEIATLMVRPRGWHLTEKNLTLDNEPISGSLIDFGLYFFHNAKKLIANESGPYFYLPKLESHLEAKLWNEVFVYAQNYIGIPRGTIKATVLIETILASFELNEILYELRDHSAGLNCGRWDYIFSYIKKLRNIEGYLLPDRSQVTMKSGFMSAYSKLVVQNCHRRGAHAMGGMAAQIPIKNNPEANQRAIEQVRNDKLTEVLNGHDGTWVAHPGLVGVAMEVFNEHMPYPNQINKPLPIDHIRAEDLLKPAKGTITEQGLRTNINLGILYIESWLKGNGAAAIYNLMEDAATAEISRTQVWQSIKEGAHINDGRQVTYDLTQSLIIEEVEKIKAYVGEHRYFHGRFEEAIELFDMLIKAEEFTEFLTIPAYDMI